MADSVNLVRGCSGFGLMRSMSSSLSGSSIGLVSPNKALSPLPRDCLAMVYDLLCEGNITFGTFGTRVIESDRLAEAWCLGESDVTGNYGLEDLGAIEVPKILSHRG